MLASHRVQIFSGINGLLIPGGAVSIFSSPYAEAATYLVDLAKLSNSAGEVTVMSIFAGDRTGDWSAGVPGLGHLPRIRDAGCHQLRRLRLQARGEIKIHIE